MSELQSIGLVLHAHNITLPEALLGPRGGARRPFVGNATLTEKHDQFTQNRCVEGFQNLRDNP